MVHGLRTSAFKTGHRCLERPATLLTASRLSNFALILVILLMSLAGHPVSAQQSAGSIAWSAEPLFEGIVKYGEWLPIRVTLSNQGTDRNVEVRATLTSAEGQATYVQPVELPAGAHKRVTLYVMPSNFSRRLRLSLMDGSGELDYTIVDLQPVSFQAFLIGLVAQNQDALSALRTISIRGSNPQAVAFGIDELPDRTAGLGSFDALVLNAVDTSRLSPAQQQTLRGWVHLGGHLIIGGGAGAALTTAGLPEDLLPVTLEGTQTVQTLPGLTDISGEPVRIPGPFIIARSGVRSGTVVAGQDDTPLIVEQAVGRGRVTFVALDLGLSPFGAWAGEKTMWTTLLESGVRTFVDVPPDLSPRRWADGQMMSALATLPSLELPSVRWVALLLVIYILLVGPVNYLVLRRMRRLEWAWVTIPVMTLTFSIGAYGVGYGMRGGDVILNELSIIEVLPGGEMTQVRTYIGLFSPTKHTYTLTLNEDPLVSPLNPSYRPWGPSVGGGNITVVQSRPVQVRDLAVNQWAMETFMAEKVTPTPVNLQAELTYHNGRVRGQVVNAGPLPLRDVAVVVGGAVSHLGTIEAGATADVDFSSGELGEVRGPPLSYLILRNAFENPGLGGPSREVRLKQQMLDSVFAPPYEAGYVADMEPLLIAWLDASPTTIRVEGTNVRLLETSLVIARPALHFGDREVGVPPGFIPVRLVQQDEGVSRCYTARGIGFAPSGGQITLEFQLPRELFDVRFNQLDLIIESDGGWWQPPATALYDWEADTWYALDDVRLGSNRIDDADRFISPTTHAIRVRMRAGDSRGGCLYTDVALEGVRVRAVKAQE